MSCGAICCWCCAYCGICLTMSIAFCIVLAWNSCVRHRRRSFLALLDCAAGALLCSIVFLLRNRLQIVEAQPLASDVPVLQANPQKLTLKLLRIDYRTQHLLDNDYHTHNVHCLLRSTAYMSYYACVVHSMLCDECTPQLLLGNLLRVATRVMHCMLETPLALPCAVHHTTCTAVTTLLITCFCIACRRG